MKISWLNGYVRLNSKELKNPSAEVPEILHTDAWDNDSGYTFPTYVGYEPFTLEIRAGNGMMEAVLNDKEAKTYIGNNIEKWGVFENYFKGREVSVPIIDGQVLPIIEIKTSNMLYDYESKYKSNKTIYDVPAKINSKIERLISLLTELEEYQFK